MINKKEVEAVQPTSEAVDSLMELDLWEEIDAWMYREDKESGEIIEIYTLLKPQKIYEAWIHKLVTANTKTELQELSDEFWEEMFQKAPLVL